MSKVVAANNLPK